MQLRALDEREAPPVPAAGGSHPGPWDSGFLRYSPVIVAAVAVALWLLSLGKYNPYAATQSGLVSLLPPAWWAALLFTGAAVVLALIPQRPWTPGILAALGSMLLVLHGTLPFAEHIARFASAYTIAGFAQYVADTGHTIPDLDARMLWPGMFAAAGMASRAMGVPATWFLRGFPLCIEAIYLFPVKAIANATLRSPRARWAALPIFLAGNWIDQDYFSPQAVNFLLYLVVIAIALRAFSAVRDYPWLVTRVVGWSPLRRTGGRLACTMGLAGPALDDLEPLPVPSRRGRAALFAVVLLLCAASIPSHQITPATLTVSLLGLTLIGRTSLRTLWLFVGVGVLAWLCWVGEPYWVGHFHQVFGGVSQLGSAVNSNVGSRLHGATDARRLVQYARAAASILIWVSSLLALFILRRRGLNRLTLGVLLVMPTAVSLAVTYGGEALLRALLFGLPAAALLLGGLLDLRRPRWAATTGYVVVLALLLALFPITRFGNEQFEAITPGDQSAAAYVGAHIPQGSLVVVPNGDEPLEAYSTGHFRVGTYSDLLFLDPRLLQGKLAAQTQPIWIYLSQSEEAYGETYVGLPAGWLNQMRTKLTRIPRLHVVYSDSTATVLRYDRPTPTVTGAPSR
jgi:hypothetical protein